MPSSLSVLHTQQIRRILGIPSALFLVRRGDTRRKNVQQHQRNADRVDADERHTKCEASGLVVLRAAINRHIFGKVTLDTIAQAIFAKRPAANHLFGVPWDGMDYGNGGASHTGAACTEGEDEDHIALKRTANRFCEIGV